MILIMTTMLTMIVKLKTKLIPMTMLIMKRMLMTTITIISKFLARDNDFPAL